MALSANTLATTLESLTPTVVLADAIDTFCDAFDTYFSNSTCDGVSPSSLATPISAMNSTLLSQLATPSTGNVGGARIAAGISAFWTSLGTNIATIYLMPPNVPTYTTPPPGLSTLAAALQSTLDTNLTTQASLSAAASAIAADIHAACLSSIITITPPSPASPYPSTIL